MLDRRSALAGLAVGCLTVATEARPAPAQMSHQRNNLLLSSPTFRVEIDRSTGGVASIVHPEDTAAMNWVSGPQNAPWLPQSSLWGLGFADLGATRLHRGRWGEPREIRTDGGQSVTIVYQLGVLVVEVARWLAGDGLEERFSFRNSGDEPISIRGRGKASLGIYTPCNDHYTSAADVLEHRAHAHVWTGGSSSWIAMLRMGGRAPHLGLVVTEGALDGYSIEDRDLVTLSNTRGTMLVHPVIDVLQPGQSVSVGWTIFWHKGWDDFFGQALRRSQQMVRLGATDWTSVKGEAPTLTFEGQLGVAPALTIGNTPVPVRATSQGWSATIAADTLGERIATLRYGNGLTTHAVLNTVPDLRTLIDTRTKFIAQHQQWRKAGDPWDGAYVVFDNEADMPARWERSSDRNSGRERVGMGVLLARWLAVANAPDPSLRPSLDRYYRFVTERLQRPDGYVFDDADEPRKRLYNWPWVMQLHLAMAGLTKEPVLLRRFVATVENFYQEGGADFYPIGLPVADGLEALRGAGMAKEHDRVLALFTGHGDRLIEQGTAYPASEVNYEQSIVAPAALILLELHQATKEAKWLRGARPHVELLDLFEGRQPDHHLHGISIRHWDGYWFGKARMWGDTFPHYWSSLNALAWRLYGRATRNAKWEERARATLRNNLSLFHADGRASAAFIYPTTVNGRPGRFADAYANDQDWTLVHALQMKADW